MQLAIGDNSIDRCFKTGQPSVLRVKTARGSWEKEIPAAILVCPRRSYRGPNILPPFSDKAPRDEQEATDFTPLGGISPDFSPEDTWEQLLGLTDFQASIARRASICKRSCSLQAESHLRSPDPSTPGPEGDHIPMYLADKFSQDMQAWKHSRSPLKQAPAARADFDEISIKR